MSDIIQVTVTNANSPIQTVRVMNAAIGGGGVTDHGLLEGLGDDDHPHYHTDARGDARYDLLGAAAAAQAAAVQRANHTGTQTLSTISDAGTAAALDYVVLTQAEYDALGTPAANTIYDISDA